MITAGGVRVRSRSRARFRFRRLLPIYGLLLPGLVLYGAWAAWPLLNSFVLSFTDWTLTRPPTPVGLANYERALGDRVPFASGDAIIDTELNVLICSCHLLFRVKTFYLLCGLCVSL